MAHSTNGAERRLVVVESPAKARTIAGYLGDDYIVESSLGHIRDLPSKKTDIPAAKRERYGDPVGVDVNSNFEPLYIVPSGRAKDQVKKLKALLKDADELLLATDEDREGEAIAWHLREELKPKVPVRRMVFHEITRDAITAAVENPRDIDENLVDAQETRRIVDRLYGYQISPVLWRKVTRGLSAGRVQSVATRLVVDRERERMDFTAASYWDLTATLDTGTSDDPSSFDAKLLSVDGARVATGRDFNSHGEIKSSGKVVVLDEERAQALAEALGDASYAVRSVEAKPYTRRPYAPFRTTTLQQEASRKLGYGAARTMQIAQRLYENGYITYMRTDSTTLSDAAIAAARTQVHELYGSTYLPESPRVYSSKVKNAQEAHEAIRPAGDSFRTPAETGLRDEEFRLYELIWMRTIASQMRDAKGETLTVRVNATASSGETVELGASGRTITFYGFLKAYVEGADDPEAELDDREKRLPHLTEEQALTAAGVEAEGHTTKPPARYTEATLVKELEDREIGRPSTYASIIRTILDRGYVFKRGNALVPAWLAFAVVRLLEEHFTRLIDYEFTAKMEDVLDEIATGEADRVRELAQFWHGDDEVEGLKSLADNLGEIDARGVSSFPVGDGIMVRVGRYGPYVEDEDGNRGSVPEDLPPDELTVDKAWELIKAGNGDRELGVNPETGRTVVAKSGRYGPYVTEILPEDAPKRAKAPTASLFKSMDLETITLDDALRLLSLPRTVGTDAEGQEIIAANGRYGPYVKKGSDSRSLSDEESLFTITVEEAEKLFAQPKGRRGARPQAPPLKELGEDPATGGQLVVKDGRFGPYITDGETNVTVPKGSSVEQLTLERAAELIAEKRAKGPAPKKRSKSSRSRS
ncbi:type I DNA topoisomerase [Actinobacteria bacterium YIM 96077]|uniref:DNA topoisomerase 1 n=1 Tax=Phytoactinopolyspora halophila TaxID=1981511 RepID=A0A329QZK8_9ACTN|nr:type I DNA topoisomerase [Phytoactinopolyspora halophila]AYY11722.1 type I DNA topoisomerase [Actinobacteria bacterium YIM 96077]RAW17844.1 type I DNA topoisomerase [Phytoactinopolyspora halophila]